MLKPVDKPKMFARTGSILVKMYPNDGGKVTHVIHRRFSFSSSINIRLASQMSSLYTSDE